eukprot:gene759-1066_t
MLVLGSHLLGREFAANIAAADVDDFWFEGPQEGDDQRGHHPKFAVNSRVLMGIACTFLLAGFGLKAATGLAQAAIAGGALATVSINLLRPHPWDLGRTLLDLDMAVLMAPTMLLGTSVGVLLNNLLPVWVIALLLVLLLLVKSQRTAFKGLTAWHEEAQQQAAKEAAAAICSRPMPMLKPICAGPTPSGLLVTQPTQLAAAVAAATSTSPAAAEAAGPSVWIAGCPAAVDFDLHISSTSLTAASSRPAAVVETLDNVIISAAAPSAAGRPQMNTNTTGFNSCCQVKLSASAATAAAGHQPAQEDKAATAAAAAGGCRSPVAPLSLFNQERLRLAQMDPLMLLSADAQPFADDAVMAVRRRGAAVAGVPMADDGTLSNSDLDDAEAHGGLVRVAAAAVAVAGAAGVIAGVCGVAVGVLLTPVLLEFRVHPQAAAATAALLVFLSSTSATLTLIMQGRLIGSYALLFLGVAVCGVGLGGPLLMILLRRCQARFSVLLMALASLQGLGGLGSGLLCVVELLRAARDHEGLGFRALCSCM